MELATYIKILRKNIGVLIALPVAFAILALYLSTKLQSGYAFEQTFYVAPEEGTLPQTQASPDQSSYFTQEKARNFTDTAVAILESADFRRDLGSGSISVKKAAPQLIKITAVSQDVPTSQVLMEKTISTFNAKLKNLPADFQIKAIGTPANPQKSAVSPKIIIAFALLAGLTIAVLTIGLKRYFRL